MGIQKPFRTLKDRSIFSKISNTSGKECFRAIKPLYCENTERKKIKR